MSVMTVFLGYPCHCHVNVCIIGGSALRVAAVTVMTAILGYPAAVTLRENTPQTQDAGVGFTRPLSACKTTPAVRKIVPIFPTAFTGCNTLHLASKDVCQTFPLDSLMAGLHPAYPALRFG